MENIITSIRDLIEQDPSQAKRGLLFSSAFNWEYAPPLNLSIEGEYLCLEVWVPLSDIRNYYGSPDILEVLKLNPEEVMLDPDVAKELNSVYRNLVAEAYGVLNTEALNKNLSVEMVEYDEGDPAVSFRFSVSSASLPGFSVEEDAFDKIPSVVAVALFRPLLTVLEMREDRMGIFHKVYRNMSAPVTQFDLDDTFAELVSSFSRKNTI